MQLLHLCTVLAVLLLNKPFTVRGRESETIDKIACLEDDIGSSKGPLCRVDNAFSIPVRDDCKALVEKIRNKSSKFLFGPGGISGEKLGSCRIDINNLQKLADPASKDVIIDTPLLTEWLGSHIENCFGGQAGATIVRCTVASPSFTIEVKGPDVK